MQVYSDFEDLHHIPNAVLTIGTFDGVHVGHQKILERIQQEAKRVHGETVLFTFFPHPRMVLQPNSDLKLIQTQNEKLDKLGRVGLDHVIVYPFTKEFSSISADDFVIEFLVKKLNVKTIVVGYDHQFGKNREGSLEQLQRLSKIYPFEVIEIPAEDIDEVNISSTKIRQAIEDGNMEIAHQYLAEPFELSGIVQAGQELGRTIGFPTANVGLQDSHKICPGNGVYAVQVKLPDGRLYNGMMNIGVRPTVSQTLERKLEVFLFDFQEDLYNQEITVYLFKQIRKEQKFDGIEALRQQLEQDERTVRAFLASATDVFALEPRN